MTLAHPKRPTNATRLLPLRRHKNVLLLAAALLMGVAAAWLGHSAVQDRLAQLDEAARHGQEMVEVIVANRDLAKGEVLVSEALAVRPMPRQYVHAAALPPGSFAQVENARLQAPLRRGEALLQAHIEGLGQRVFSTIVPKGMRALTLDVDDISSNAGMLRPGDRVDLIYAARVPAAIGAGPAEEPQVWPLLSNILVMATGQSVSKQDAKGGERRYTNVTLELSPADANRVLLAKSTGEVTAILRHPDDDVRNDAPPLTAAALVPGAAARRTPSSIPRPPPRLAASIEYVIGGGGASPSRPAPAPRADTPPESALAALTTRGDAQ